MVINFCKRAWKIFDDWLERLCAPLAKNDLVIWMDGEGNIQFLYRPKKTRKQHGGKNKR